MGGESYGTKLELGTDLLSHPDGFFSTLLIRSNRDLS